MAEYWVTKDVQEFYLINATDQQHAENIASNHLHTLYKIVDSEVKDIRVEKKSTKVQVDSINRKNREDMKEINNLLNDIKKDLQTRIDNNEFDYCDKSDMQLDLIDMNTDEFVRVVDKWDFNGSDNSIWYATQIQTLEKVISILEKEQGKYGNENNRKYV